MSESANVRSIQTLCDLRSVLGRFAETTVQNLTRAETEIQRTQDWLRERELYWQRQVERARVIVQQAHAALERCRSQVYYDRNGRAYVPDCSAYARALAEAERHLQQVEAELRKTQMWRSRIEQAAASYRAHAQRMRDLANARTSQGRTFLDQKIAQLGEYAAIAPAALSAAASTVAANRWMDSGIRGINPAQLPDPTEIETEGFSKVSEEMMRLGLQRLQEMRPLIESGVGASSDYWAEYDRTHGLDYEHGYQRVYESFYGSDAIRVNWDGTNYDIINGRHRVWLARRMGIDWLPVRVIERQ